MTGLYNTPETARLRTQELRQAYDAYLKQMEDVPHDWRTEFVSDVAQFHYSFGHPISPTRLQGQLPQDLYDLRKRLVDEEYNEIVEVTNVVDHKKALAGIADGIADLIYVLVGSALVVGAPLEDHWWEHFETSEGSSGLMREVSNSTGITNPWILTIYIRMMGNGHNPENRYDLDPNMKLQHPLVRKMLRHNLQVHHLQWLGIWELYGSGVARSHKATNDSFTQITCYYIAHLIQLSISFNIPLQNVWRLVQKANMAKLQGGVPLYDETGKVKKPEDWVAPDIYGYLFN